MVAGAVDGPAGAPKAWVVCAWLLLSDPALPALEKGWPDTHLPASTAAVSPGTGALVHRRSITYCTR
ncbi:hypothetical protein D3C84_982080 [compost metagenome]